MLPTQRVHTGLCSSLSSSPKEVFPDQLLLSRSAVRLSTNFYFFVLGKELSPQLSLSAQLGSEFPLFNGLSKTWLNQGVFRVRKKKNQQAIDDGRSRNRGSTGYIFSNQNFTKIRAKINEDDNEQVDFKGGVNRRKYVGKVEDSFRKEEVFKKVGSFRKNVDKNDINSIVSPVVERETGRRSGPLGKNERDRGKERDKNSVFNDDIFVSDETHGFANEQDMERLLEEENNRIVECSVEVLSWRDRKISAAIVIGASLERVWEVLTDYEKLAEFIPNLVRSERIPCPFPDRVWLLQQGMQQALYWQIEAKVVLDLQEVPLSSDGKELRFEMIDGDFKQYTGKWTLKPEDGDRTTLLQYEVNVTPQLLLPTVFLERIIKADLPKNLRAIAIRAEQKSWQQIGDTSPKFSDDRSGPGRSKKGFIKTLLSRLSVGSTRELQLGTGTFVPEVELSTGTVDNVKRIIHEEKELVAVNAGGRFLEEESSRTLAGKSWSEVDPARFGGIGSSCQVERVCIADEIHLRRLDDLLEEGGVHRRVSASITIQASAEAVWKILTDYERLSEFVPNLVSSRVLSRDKNRVRLLQEGCKCLLCMVLHARVVLELEELHGQEISFRQLEGDFEQFQGKWTLEPLGSRHTRLKYSVDTRMCQETLLAEAIVEEVVYEDLPANLCAVRDRVEASLTKSIDLLDSFNPNLTAVSGTEPSADVAIALANVYATAIPKSVTVSSEETFKWQSRKRTSGLLLDVEAVETEIRKFVAEKGQEGVMPRMGDLRRYGRVDLEKAIARFGGFEEIATRMKLRMTYQRKPKHYWASLANVKWEVVKFQEVSGSAAEYMPSRRSLQEAGRYDLARALEKWGGLREVARLLGLKVRRTLRSDAKTDSSVTASNNMDLNGTISSVAVSSVRKSPLRDRKTVIGLKATVKQVFAKKSKKKSESDDGFSADMEEGPKPMKAPLPASSRKWVNLRRSEKRKENNEVDDDIDT